MIRNESCSGNLTSTAVWSFILEYGETKQAAVAVTEKISLT